MHHPLSHKTISAPIRWGVVLRVVTAICVVVFLASLAWHVVVFTIPQHKEAVINHKLEDYELQLLSKRMAVVEHILHIP